MMCSGRYGDFKTAVDQIGEFTPNVTNPVRWINLLHSYLYETKSPFDHFRRGGERLFKGDSRIWAQVTLERVTSFEVFKQEFLYMFWSRLQQAMVMERIETGKCPSGRSYYYYFLDIMRDAMYIHPPYPEAELLRKLAAHFPSRHGAILRTMSSVREAELYLRQLDDLVSVQNGREGEPMSKYSYGSADGSRPTSDRRGDDRYDRARVSHPNDQFRSRSYEGNRRDNSREYVQGDRRDHARDSERDGRGNRAREGDRDTSFSNRNQPRNFPRSENSNIASRGASQTRSIRSVQVEEHTGSYEDEDEYSGNEEAVPSKADDVDRT